MSSSTALYDQFLEVFNNLSNSNTGLHSNTATPLSNLSGSNTNEKLSTSFLVYASASSMPTDHSRDKLYNRFNNNSSKRLKQSQLSYEYHGTQVKKQNLKPKPKAATITVTKPAKVQEKKLVGTVVNAKNNAKISDTVTNSNGKNTVIQKIGTSKIQNNYTDTSFQKNDTKNIINAVKNKTAKNKAAKKNDNKMFSLDQSVYDLLPYGPGKNKKSQQSQESELDSLNSVIKEIFGDPDQQSKRLSTPEKIQAHYAKQDSNPYSFRNLLKVQQSDPEKASLIVQDFINQKERKRNESSAEQFYNGYTQKQQDEIIRFVKEKDKEWNDWQDEKARERGEKIYQEEDYNDVNDQGSFVRNSDSKSKNLSNKAQGSFLQTKFSNTPGKNLKSKSNFTNSMNQPSGEATGAVQPAAVQNDTKAPNSSDYNPLHYPDNRWHDTSRLGELKENKLQGFNLNNLDGNHIKNATGNLNNNNSKDSDVINHNRNYEIQNNDRIKTAFGTSGKITKITEHPNQNTGQFKGLNRLKARAAISRHQNLNKIRNGITPLSQVQHKLNGQVSMSDPRHPQHRSVMESLKQKSLERAKEEINIDEEDENHNGDGIVDNNNQNNDNLSEARNTNIQMIANLRLNKAIVEAAEADAAAQNQNQNVKTQESGQQSDRSESSSNNKNVIYSDSVTSNNDTVSVNENLKSNSDSESDTKPKGFGYVVDKTSFPTTNTISVTQDKCYNEPSKSAASGTPNSKSLSDNHFKIRSSFSNYKLTRLNSNSNSTNNPNKPGPRQTSQSTRSTPKTSFGKFQQMFTLLKSGAGKALKSGRLKAGVGAKIAGKFIKRNGKLLATKTKLMALDAGLCLDRKFGAMMPFLFHPCRDYHEKSCNQVGAVCSHVLKTNYVIPDVLTYTYTTPGKICNQGDTVPLGNDMKAVPSLSGNDTCHARMFDIPYRMRNSIADQEATATSLIKRDPILAFAMSRLFNTTIPTDAPGPLTVWGTAIHGKVGSWSFDSGGRFIYDHIYRIPQFHDGQPMDSELEKFIPEWIQKMVDEKAYTGRDDTYLCDSRRNPKHCALIGGNLFRCLQNYEEKSCGSFCDDHGDRLICNVMGWNTFHDMWSKVPIYPKDILGEMYRDEWRDLYARPMIARVEIPKYITDNVSNFKVMPEWLITDNKPYQSFMERSYTQFHYGDARAPNYLS